MCATAARSGQEEQEWAKKLQEAAAAAAVALPLGGLHLILTSEVFCQNIYYFLVQEKNHKSHHRRSVGVLT